MLPLDPSLEARNQAASASRTVLAAVAYVAAGPSLPVALAAGKAPSGARKAGLRGQLAGGVPPRIHVRTALSAQPDGSAVTALWPTPGTTSSRPCGKCERTAVAFSVGVRMSNPPLIASTGTV